MNVLIWGHGFCSALGLWCGGHCSREVDGGGRAGVLAKQNVSHLIASQGCVAFI